MEVMHLVNDVLVMAVVTLVGEVIFVFSFLCSRKDHICSAEPDRYETY